MMGIFVSAFLVGAAGFAGSLAGLTLLLKSKKASRASKIMAGLALGVSAVASLAVAATFATNLAKLAKPSTTPTEWTGDAPGAGDGSVHHASFHRDSPRGVGGERAATESRTAGEPGADRTASNAKPGGNGDWSEARAENDTAASADPTWDSATPTSPASSGSTKPAQRGRGLLGGLR